MKFLVVYEDAGPNFSAYIPDLPGCVSTGATREEVARNIREAMEGHLRAMIEDGDPIPEPVPTWTEIVDVTVGEAPLDVTVSAA